MAYEFDDDVIRARVEKRLAPQKKLRRLRLFLFLHIALFISFLTVSVGYEYEGSIFLEAIKDSYSYTDPGTRLTEASTYSHYQPYPLVVFVLTVWLAFVVIHAIQVWTAFRHERAIRGEMERETNLELERLRLQVELAKRERLAPVDGDDEEYPLEKIKRTARLGDDGELLSEEAPRTTRRGQA